MPLLVGKTSVLAMQFPQVAPAATESLILPFGFRVNYR